ncbi:MAG: hypothetical protein IPO21_13175 [Bacteroidales bacterium]|nr:hypothetical protein [Bacteroidales bacterium]
MVDFDLTKVLKIQWQKQAESGTTGAVSIDDVYIAWLGKPIKIVDKTELYVAIEKAESTYATANTGNGHNQYTSASKATYQLAIDSAKLVYKAPLAKLNDVNVAIYKLSIATDAFLKSKIIVDFVQLTTLVYTGQAILDTIPVGAKEGEWLLQNRNDFANEIYTASLLIDQTGVTSQTIDTTVTSIENTITVFEKEYIKLQVTKTDNTKLKYLIQEITLNLDRAKLYSETSHLGNYSAQAITNLEARIADAQKIVMSETATQSEVDNEIYLLTMSYKELVASLIDNSLQRFDSLENNNIDVNFSTSEKYSLEVVLKEYQYAIDNFIDYEDINLANESVLNVIFELENSNIATSNVFALIESKRSYTYSNGEINCSSVGLSFSAIKICSFSGQCLAFSTERVLDISHFPSAAYVVIIVYDSQEITSLLIHQN